MWIRNNDTDGIFDIEDESLCEYLLKQPENKFTKAKAPKEETPTNTPPADQ